MSWRESLEIPVCSQLIRNTAWTYNWHLKLGVCAGGSLIGLSPQPVEADACCLWAGGFRIELNSETTYWCSRIAFCCGEPPHWIGSPKKYMSRIFLVWNFSFILLKVNIINFYSQSTCVVCQTVSQSVMDPGWWRLHRQWSYLRCMGFLVGVVGEESAGGSVLGVKWMHIPSAHSFPVCHAQGRGIFPHSWLERSRYE